jgi:Putative MetA-pathway of phenol degradation
MTRLRRAIARIIGAAVLTVFATSLACAEDKDPRPAAGIQDNSYLIEEAYNQEPGTVQHIQALARIRRDWTYVFVQEWPMGSQTHQFSYAIPYAWIRNDEGVRHQGFGDVFLNYRYQVWTETEYRPAFAPRLSLILPTGSRSRELGDGSVGVDIRLPFSKIVSDRVTLHANAGMTHLFDVDGHHPTDFMLGGSAIYAVTRDFNLMLETRADWDQSVSLDGVLEREFTYTISPGFRAALNFPQLNELQIVYGAAVPITFTRGKSTDYGLFFYLSFEHSFLDKKEQEKKPLLTKAK